MKKFKTFYEESAAPTNTSGPAIAKTNLPLTKKPLRRKKKPEEPKDALQDKDT